MEPVTIECVFCAVVNGVARGSRIEEGPTILAFMDTDPVTPGHVLIVPKQHLPGLTDLGEDVATEMFACARRVAVALRRSTLRCEGVNLFCADGAAAGQEVEHAHLHVFPRFRGDGFKLTGNWGSSPSRAELDVHARELQSLIP